MQKNHLRKSDPKSSPLYNISLTLYDLISTIIAKKIAATSVGSRTESLKSRAEEEKGWTKKSLVPEKKVGAHASRSDTRSH